MQEQAMRDEYHKWDEEFCTGAAPTYWECWQAACATMQKQISRLEADFNDALIERNNAEKREHEVLGRANALEAELKATQARLDASDELMREEFSQRQDAITYLTQKQRQEYQAHLNAGMRKLLDAMTPNAALRGDSGLIAGFPLESAVMQRKD